MKSVAVHNGKFHADDVFAIAILKQIFPELKVIRSRDKEVLASVDARVDIGFSYNPETLDFDHHQSEGAGARENGIPYASVGLIWKHYGHQLANSQDAWESIDSSLIQGLDADDCGVTTFEKTTEASVYPLPKIIARLNSNWKENSNADTLFFEAVEFATMVLKRELVSANNQSQANDITQEAINTRTQEEFIVLPIQCPWKNVVKAYKEILYVIFPGNNQWCIIAVDEVEFTPKKPFPESWRGKEKEDLQQTCGISGADFCHKTGFFMAVATQEDALLVVKKSLENN